MGKVFIPKVTPIIEGRLYQRGQFNQFDIETKRRLFDKYGIYIVVCLYGDRDEDLSDLLEMYYYMPIPDGKSAESHYDELLEIAAYAAEWIEDGYAVLSHCHGGRNRAGLMNALIVRELNGWTGKEAMDYVIEVRPNAIATIPFQEFLKSLGEPDWVEEYGKPEPFECCLPL